MEQQKEVKELREVQTRLEPLPNKISQLLVFDFIKKGWNPSKIAHKCNIAETTIQYHLTQLKAKGLVKKVGYGTWEVDDKRTANIPQVTKTRGGGVCTKVVSDSVRGHAFQFRLRLSKGLRNWDRREGRLRKLGVEFKALNFGQSLLFKGRKVWLCDRSIIVYERSSYWTDTASGSRSYAVADFISFVKQLEAFLGAKFGQGGQYKFRVSRQHYSLVKNALAIQYNRERKKLQLTDENGYWGCIDDSFKLKEFECLHSKTAPDDNKKVQDFFNGIKRFEGFTPEFVVNALGQNAQNLGAYAVNLAAHVESVKQLGVNVQAETEAVRELVKVVKELKEAKNGK